MYNISPESVIENLCNEVRQLKRICLPVTMFNSCYNKNLETLLDKAPNLEHICTYNEYRENILVSTTHKLH